MILAQETPTVSVIMPAHNVERFVEQAIGSVLNQTLKDFELIIVDDGSTDRTLEICRRIAHDEPRIKIIEQKENHGPGPARNLALDHAIGEFIFFLDADDLILDQALEKLINTARSNDAEVVHCNRFLRRNVNADGSINGAELLKTDPKPHVGFLTSDLNLRLEKTYSNFDMWIQIWLNLYRRDFLERNALCFPDMIGEDEPFFIAVLCCAERFLCVQDHFYVYNRRLGSETQSNSSERASKGVAALVEGCRHVNATFARHPSLSNRAKSICMQELIERISRNYILRRYDTDGLVNDDAVDNFTHALEPVFDGNADLVARLLQGLALRQSRLQNFRAELPSMPSVSVIMPVYNVERYVEAAIRSVSAQTLKDFELIIVDDGSSDRSFEICQRFAQSDPRIKLVRHEQNRGLGAARNTGMDHARGKYIAFLDSDDLLLENALSTLYATAEHNNTEVVRSTEYFERMELEDGSFDKTLIGRSDKTQLNGWLPADRNLRLANCYVNYNCWSMAWLHFCRRDFLERHNLRFPNMLSEDEPFAVALYCLTDRFAFVPGRFYVYNRRRGSLMGSKGVSRAKKAIGSMVEGHRYLVSIFDRLSTDALSLRMRNEVVQSFFSRMLENYILPLYDLEGIMGEGALQTLIEGLNSTVERGDWSAHMMQAYIAQRLKASAARRDLAQLNETFLNANRAGDNELLHMATVWDSLKNAKSRIILISVPHHGNLGNQVIVLGELVLFRELLPDHEIIELPTTYFFGRLGEMFEALKWSEFVRPDDILFINGGGNVGTLWSNEERVHKEIIRRFPNNKIIILPQSIFFDRINQEALTRESVDIYNAHTDLHLLCRDENSFNAAAQLFPRVRRYLTPDSATALIGILDSKEHFERRGITFILRSDKERVDHSTLIAGLQNYFKARGITFSIIDTVVHRVVDERNRDAEVMNLINAIKSSRLVVTDRFHGTILSAITRTPVIAMKSLDTKISSGIKWFADLDYVLYADGSNAATVKQFVDKYLETTVDVQLDNSKYKKILLDALNRSVAYSPSATSQLASQQPNRIQISVETNGNRISYRYAIDGDWVKYFNQSVAFFVDYSEDISGTPDSIAIIPMLCNVLPMAWLFDADILIDELDRDFYNNVDKIKQGYVQMYPQMKFGGRLTVGRIVDNSYDPTEGSLLLFSGGVDSTFSLINHAEEHPTLMAIYGSDIALNDTRGWENVRNHVLSVSKTFGLKTLFVRSSFRLFINEGRLQEFVKHLDSEGYWHGFQHGIGLLGHAAPYVFIHRMKTIYIASTFTINEKGKYPCASDPDIDNHIAVASCRTVHDGYEFYRQDKVHAICEYRARKEIPIRLRVCWQSKGGNNCCHCEKCWRTILNIFVEREDPRNYGFQYDRQELLQAFQAHRNDFKDQVLSRPHRYRAIVKAMRKNYSRDEIPSELLWLYDIKF